MSGNHSDPFWQTFYTLLHLCHVFFVVVFALITLQLLCNVTARKCGVFLQERQCVWLGVLLVFLFRSAVRVLVSYYPGSLVLGYRAISVPALRRYASPPDSRGTPGKRTVGPEEAN